MIDRNVWINRGSEALIIIGSILLAFAIDAAWETRQEKALEDSVLAAIRSDMERNLRDLERVVGFHNAADEAIRKFMDISPNGAHGSTLFQDPNFSLGYLYGIATFTPFEGSMSSENIALIGDMELRNELGNWLGLSADVVETGALEIQRSDKLRDLALSSGL